MSMTSDISAYIISSIGNPPWIDPAADNVNGNVYQEFYPPSAPDRMCCIYEQVGLPPQRGLGGTIAWYNPRLVVVNRASAIIAGGEGFATAQSDAFSIFNLLKNVVNKTLSGTFYMEILPDGSPQAQSLDSTNRPVFVTNYKVMKRT